MKRLLPLLLLLALPMTGYAQQLHIYCNHALAVPCTTASPGTPSNAWDPPWLVGGKNEANWSQWYGVNGIVKGNGPSSSPTAASATDIGKLFNVTGLLLGNGLAAPTAYGGSICGTNLYATSANGLGVWTCAQVAAAQVSGLSGTYAQLAQAQTWSAVQTIPAADLAITSPATAAGNDFLCWNSSTHVVSVETTPICNGYVPVSLSASQTWSAVQTIPAADLSITSFSTAAGTGFVCNNGGILSVEATPICNSYVPVSLSATQTWSATQTFATINATTIQQGGIPILQLPEPVQAGSTKTLVATDCMQLITLTNGNNLTVNGNVLAAGCIVNFTLHSGTATITQGTSMTLSLGNGTATTGTRTVTANSAGSITFDSATTAVVTGGGVT